MSALSVAQIGGTLAGGFAERSAYRAKADVLEGEAAARLDAAKAEAEKFRRLTGNARGAATAAYAGAGVDVSSDTPLRVDQDIVQRGTRDEYMALLTGQRQARELRFDARMKRAAGNMAMGESVLKAAAQAYEYTHTRWRGGQGWRANKWSPFGGDPFSGY